MASFGAVCTQLALAGLCGVRFSVPLFFVSLLAEDPASERHEQFYCLGTDWFRWAVGLVMMVECAVDFLPRDVREESAVRACTLLAGAAVGAPPAEGAAPVERAALFAAGGVLAALLYLARQSFRGSALAQTNAECLCGCCFSVAEALLAFLLVPLVLRSAVVSCVAVLLELSAVLTALCAAANYPMLRKRRMRNGPLYGADDPFLGYHEVGFGSQRDLGSTPLSGGAISFLANSSLDLAKSFGLGGRLNVEAASGAAVLAVSPGAAQAGAAATLAATPAVGGAGLAAVPASASGAGTLPGAARTSATAAAGLARPSLASLAPGAARAAPAPLVRPQQGQPGALGSAAGAGAAGAAPGGVRLAPAVLAQPVPGQARAAPGQLPQGRPRPAAPR